MIACSSPLRAAYGWQRDGGMAEYLLADEKDCVILPDTLTYADGALGANKLVGADISPERCKIAKDLGLADEVIISDANAVEKAKALTYKGQGFERAVDCSGNTYGRQLAIRATREWGKIVFIGEGGTVEFNPSPDILHGQKTIYGSWVTNIARMNELVNLLVRWNIHPDKLITNRFELKDADKAYALMNTGKCGKVAIVFDEEIK